MIQYDINLILKLKQLTVYLFIHKQTLFNLTLLKHRLQISTFLHCWASNFYFVVTYFHFYQFFYQMNFFKHYFRHLRRSDYLNYLLSSLRIVHLRLLYSFKLTPIFFIFFAQLNHCEYEINFLQFHPFRCLCKFLLQFVYGAYLHLLLHFHGDRDYIAIHRSCFQLVNTSM
ncbi:transmembrane protein, putative (macronuclear) [Tetrahymena thermophila SB210]|uniref:Transmembrane protein, putative n=1 Tax=Tetrahymena thermophila (strain SB210) TaxID=312017 RepID=W7XD60_TETTS|nr:transmembrane protein, putative [Tetrahymena thermophila SB210]EWS75432.1 transmembrane protein, putative [Tetrahymena thermophila SB210]|eukprot:XP_012652017.1 transmembrane protein, putative [Tetrahymena thermophila SB210]